MLQVKTIFLPACREGGLMCGRFRGRPKPDKAVLFAEGVKNGAARPHVKGMLGLRQWCTWQARVARRLFCASLLYGFISQAWA